LLLGAAEFERWVERRAIKTVLRDLGYTNVTEAKDGSAALPLLERGAFAFLITDWNMPGMSGLELLRQVRAHARLAKLPVLMLTAEAERARILEAVQAGGEAHSGSCRWM